MGPPEEPSAGEHELGRTIWEAAAMEECVMANGVEDRGS